jgi:hypothetical protein
MRYFVLQKNGRSTTKGNSLFRNADGQLCVWQSEENAIARSIKAKSSWEEWRVRPAMSTDFSGIAKQLNRARKKIPIYIVMDKEIGVNQVAKKTTSAGCLVDVFEDMENRKFAIASKAGSEDEFIAEVSQAMSSINEGNWSLRLREFLPLIVDMCCKYRGYKAETVFERRELVAGDLEMPSKS